MHTTLYPFAETALCQRRRRSEKRSRQFVLSQQLVLAACFNHQHRTFAIAQIDTSLGFHWRSAVVAPQSFAINFLACFRVQAGQDTAGVVYKVELTPIKAAKASWVRLVYSATISWARCHLVELPISANVQSRSTYTNDHYQRPVAALTKNQVRHKVASTILCRLVDRNHTTNSWPAKTICNLPPSVSASGVP